MFSVVKDIVYPKWLDSTTKTQTPSVTDKIFGTLRYFYFDHLRVLNFLLLQFLYFFGGGGGLCYRVYIYYCDILTLAQAYFKPF